MDNNLPTGKHTTTEGFLQCFQNWGGDYIKTWTRFACSILNNFFFYSKQNQLWSSESSGMYCCVLNWMLTFNYEHGSTSQKILSFILTTVRTWNFTEPTFVTLFLNSGFWWGMKITNILIISKTINMQKSSLHITETKNKICSSSTKKSITKHYYCYICIVQ
jgi:hypothetical protein